VVNVGVVALVVVVLLVGDVATCSGTILAMEKLVAFLSVVVDAATLNNEIFVVVTFVGASSLGLDQLEKALVVLVVVLLVVDSISCCIDACVADIFVLLVDVDVVVVVLVVVELLVVVVLVVVELLVGIAWHWT